jgi:hypothetical protein
LELKFDKPLIETLSGCSVDFSYLSGSELYHKYPETKFYPLDGGDQDYLIKTHHSSLSYWIKVFAERRKIKSVKVFTTGILLYKGISETNFHLQVKE